jgi:phosphatidate phosphatase APP1
VATSSGTNLAVPVQIHFIGPKGWSVISDIDDTIKISHVHDRRALVHATFCEPFLAVPGMASVYQAWASAGSQFHYVSASPWQLYPSLDEFLGTNRFPEGTFHMKTVRLKDSSVWDMFGPQNRYKSAEISALLKRAPERRFLLVGDSGEQDPEIYGELARQRPKQIAHILIRNVTDEGSDAPRYRECFRSLPTELWTIFEDARILENLPLRIR